MPLENKAGSVGVNDQSRRCDRRRGPCGAAHKCGGRTLRLPPEALGRCGSTADPNRSGSGSGGLNGLWGHVVHLDHHASEAKLARRTDSDGGGRDPTSQRSARHWSPDWELAHGRAGREEHRVVADLLGKAGRIRTVPVAAWVKDATDAGKSKRHHGKVRSFDRSTRLVRSGSEE